MGGGGQSQGGNGGRVKDAAPLALRHVVGGAAEKLLLLLRLGRLRSAADAHLLSGRCLIVGLPQSHVCLSEGGVRRGGVRRGGAGRRGHEKGGRAGEGVRRGGGWERGSSEASTSESEFMLADQPLHITLMQAHISVTNVTQRPGTYLFRQLLQRLYCL